MIIEDNLISMHETFKSVHKFSQIFLSSWFNLKQLRSLTKFNKFQQQISFYKQNFLIFLVIVFMTRLNIFKKRKRLNDVNETFIFFEIYIDTKYMLKEKIATKFKKYSIHFLSRKDFLENVEKTKLLNNIINTTQLRHWAIWELVVFLKYINDFRDDYDNFVDTIES